MSCNCHNYTPCDTPCPQCSGTTTTSSTTTTTTCSSDIVCVDYWKDKCVEHPGDSCYQIPVGTNLNSILMHLLSFVPPTPGCTTTTTTTIAPTTTTTTLTPTTTTTTCICPPTTTTTSTSTTTTTTLAPCECITFRLENITEASQTYSYENCSHVQFNDQVLGPSESTLICVCDENLIVNPATILVFAIGDGCNTSTTTSTSTTSTTSTSTTTTTTTAEPVCQQYRVQSIALPASWSADSCYDAPVGGSFTTLGESIYTGCIWSNTLVLNNASIKEIFPCPSPTSTTTSTTSTSTTTTSSTTTTTTTIAPTTTTTTVNCECYTLYNQSFTTPYSVTYSECGGGNKSVFILPLQTLRLCVNYDTTVTVDSEVIVTRCYISCTTSSECSACTTTTSTSSTTTTTTGDPTTTTTTTEGTTTTTTTGEPTTTTTSTTLEPTTTTTTTCASPCLNTEYNVTGFGTAEWFECNAASPTTLTVSSGVYMFCHDGSGVIFYNGASGTPTGNEYNCGCNEPL